MRLFLFASNHGTPQKPVASKEVTGLALSDNIQVSKESQYASSGWDYPFADELFEVNEHVPEVRS